MKKNGKHDTLAVIKKIRKENTQTNRQTWQIYDQTGPESQVGEKRFMIYILYNLY